MRIPWSSPEVVDEIIRLGLASLPWEACGVVCPDLKVVPLPNIAESRDEYEIDAADLEEALIDYLMRAGVEPGEIRRDHFIIWHTHPSGNVGPSQGDIDTRLEGFQYVVVALPNGPASVF